MILIFVFKLINDIHKIIIGIIFIFYFGIHIGFYTHKVWVVKIFIIKLCKSQEKKYKTFADEVQTFADEV